MNNLFIFVEGYYDLMFVENILSLFLLNKASTIIHPIPYAQKAKSLINKEIKSKSKYHYVLLTDLDSHDFNCITHKKNYINNYFTNLEWEKTIIVKEEIESWFLAGMDTSLLLFKDFNVPDKTDLITKEDFDRMLKENSTLVKEDFLLELSHSFDINLTRKRNSSFDYFIKKLMNNL